MTALAQAKGSGCNAATGVASFAAPTPCLVTRERVAELCGAAAGRLYGIVHGELEFGRDWRWIPGPTGGERFTLEGVALIAEWLGRLGEREASLRLLAERDRLTPPKPVSWVTAWEERQEEINGPLRGQAARPPPETQRGQAATSSRR